MAATDPEDAPPQDGGGSRSDVGRFFGWLVGRNSALAGCPVTRMLIFVNAMVFVLEIAFAKGFDALMAVPESVILAFGGNYAPFVIGEGRVETLVASCFLHFSILHVGFNLYALRQVGPFVERAVGSPRFLSMYLASGIVGSAASSLMGWLGNPERLSAGASGAICGAIGAALVLGGRTQGWRGPIVRAMGFWLLLTLVLGMQIGADNSAHAGGALSGAIFALVWKRGVVYRPATQRAILIACAAIIAASGIAVGTRDLLDPYAVMNENERMAEAIRAFDGGHCAEAEQAVARASRLSPRGERAQRLALIREQISRSCRGKQD